MGSLLAKTNTFAFILHSVWNTDVMTDAEVDI